MDTLRIGFVGAGFIAGVHAEVLARDPRVRVHAVIDPDLHRVTMFALDTGAKVVPSLDDLLGDVDALYICTPNALHADVAIHALDAGVSVFSEKPMATSIESARAVLDAATRARGVYQAGFNRRFAGVYRELKHRIATGDVVPASALLKMNRGELQRPAWTGDPLMTGGFLYETPIHMLDLVRHLFGDPVEVVCRARATAYDQLDDFSLLFTFASGMSAVLATSAHATWLYPFERVEVYATMPPSSPKRWSASPSRPASGRRPSRWTSRSSRETSGGGTSRRMAASSTPCAVSESRRWAHRRPSRRRSSWSGATRLREKRRLRPRSGCFRAGETAPRAPVT